MCVCSSNAFALSLHTCPLYWNIEYQPPANNHICVDNFVVPWSTHEMATVAFLKFICLTTLTVSTYSTLSTLQFLLSMALSFFCTCLALSTVLRYLPPSQESLAYPTTLHSYQLYCNTANFPSCRLVQVLHPFLSLLTSSCLTLSSQLTTLSCIVLTPSIWPFMQGLFFLSIFQSRIREV